MELIKQLNLEASQEKSMNTEKEKLLTEIFNQLLKEKEDLIHLRHLDMQHLYGGNTLLRLDRSQMETRIVKAMSDIDRLSRMECSL